MADTNGLNELERVLRGTIKELRENPHIIPQYVTLVERELREKARVLLAIPECPVHGPGCVPHAVEWVEAQKRREGESMTQNGRNGGSSEGEAVRVPDMAERWRWMESAPIRVTSESSPELPGISFSGGTPISGSIAWEEVPLVSSTDNLTQPVPEREFDRHMKVSRTLYARTSLRLAGGHAAECVKNGVLALSDVYWLVRSLVRGR
jgi:hypothetical protein